MTIAESKLWTHLRARRMKGYRVLRSWNNQVMNEIEGMLHVLYAVLHDEDEGDSEDTNSKI